MAVVLCDIIVFLSHSGLLFHPLCTNMLGSSWWLWPQVSGEPSLERVMGISGQVPVSGWGQGPQSWAYLGQTQRGFTFFR